MGSGASKIQPPLDALSGSSLTNEYEMTSDNPSINMDSNMRWHHGHAFPIYT